MGSCSIGVQCVLLAGRVFKLLFGSLYRLDMGFWGFTVVCTQKPALKTVSLVLFSAVLAFKRIQYCHNFFLTHNVF